MLVPASEPRTNTCSIQPLTLDRVQIEELEGSTNTNLIVYLNEYGSLVDVFLLQSTSSESHHQLYNAVYQAKVLPSGPAPRTLPLSSLYACSL